jgi:hypothetical protein
LHYFAVIPFDFRRFAAQWPTVKKRRKEIVKAARACADVILSNADIAHYWHSALSWDEGNNTPWAEVFLPLIVPGPDDIHDTPDLEWVGGAIKHISKTWAFTEIPALLWRFIDTLEGWEPAGPEPVVEELRTFVSRKNSLQEFAKRRVFTLLLERWPKRLGNAPNNETATIVNYLLELSGQEQVTANDISQMNKGTRRKYSKE